MALHAHYLATELMDDREAISPASSGLQKSIDIERDENKFSNKFYKREISLHKAAQHSGEQHLQKCRKFRNNNYRHYKTP